MSLLDELLLAFPLIEGGADMIEALLDSNEGVLTEELLVSMGEMAGMPNFNLRVIEVSPTIISVLPVVELVKGEVIYLKPIPSSSSSLPPPSHQQQQKQKQKQKQKQQQESKKKKPKNDSNIHSICFLIQNKIIHRVFRCSEHGVFEWEMVQNGEVLGKGMLLCSSPVYRLSSNSELCMEEYYWGWDRVWTEKLENSLLEMTVLSDDVLKPMKAMAGMLGPMSNVIGKPLEVITEDVHNCIDKHDALSLGRLHMTFFQISEIADFFPMGQEFNATLKRFCEAKLEQSNKGKLVEAFGLLRDSIPAFLEQLGPNHAAERRRYEMLYEHLRQMGVGGEGLTMEVVKMVRPKAMEVMDPMMTTTTPSGPITCPIYMPSIATEVLEKAGGGLDALVDMYTEGLIGEAIMLGSLLGLPMQSEPKYLAAIVHNLLDAGLTYAHCGSSIIAQHHCSRAAMLIPASGPVRQRRLHLRRKDVGRVLRSRAKAGDNLNLALFVNYDFEQTIKLLREHHGLECWVNEQMEATWKWEISNGLMVIFQLWDGERLVAADVGHLVLGGKAVYISTRFFDKSYGRIQPGFLLALATMKLLRDCGCHLYDFGGVDLSPAMAYKRELVDAMARPVFMHHFRKIRDGQYPLEEGLRMRRLAQMVGEICKITDEGQFIETDY